MAATFILSCQSWAQSVPDLYRYEDLLADPAAKSEYYQSLSRRFTNGDLNELVWDNKKGESPRLSYAAFTSMLETLQEFFALNPTVQRRLPEAPPVHPFTLNQNGSVTVVDDKQMESWSHLLDLLIEAKRNGGQEDISQLVTALNRDRSEANFEKLVVPLIAAQISDSFLQRMLRERNSLSPGDQYQVFENIVAQAINQAKALQLPGKYIDAFWKFAFLKDVPRSNIFRKGITIAPMNRFEALTKGIGVGECIRYVCNRYLQALFSDSFFLKVLVDGRESGFIGISKSYSSSGEKIWMIEGIQSLRVANRLDGLIQQLQALASEDGSILAAPNHLLWTFNYQNVQDGMNRILGPTQERAKLQVGFRNPDDIAVFTNFVENHLPEADKQFMLDRYGRADRLANAIHLLGNGRAFAVPTSRCEAQLSGN